MENSFEKLLRESSKKDYGVVLNTGHKDRFLAKRRRQNIRKRLFTVISIASVVVLIVVIPYLFLSERGDRSTLLDPKVSAYEYNLYKVASSIRDKMTLVINDSDKFIIDGVLNQIMYENLSIKEEIPEMLSEKERDDIIADYYRAKLEGLKILDFYVDELIVKL